MHENDGLINVEYRSISHWESSCDVKSFRKLNSQLMPNGIAEVTLACGGEGMTWSTREVWSITELGSRKVLAQVQFQSSEAQDETKPRSNRLRTEYAVRLFVRCE
jgi:cephalosporin hydroxylase